MTGDADRIGNFFDALTTWPEEMRALRRILDASPLDPAWKWRSPVWCHDGANVAILWPFREAASLGFFMGVLLTDPDGLLQQHGPNTRSARVARFRSVAEVEAAAGWIADAVAEAIDFEQRGVKVDLPPDDLDLPVELQDRLDADTAFRDAWNALTPGRRRGYVVLISGAKKAETRMARIEKHAPRILKGKGLHDR